MVIFMDNDKKINEKRNTSEDLIFDYIKNIHPEHLQSGFCVTVEFIKLVEQINAKVYDGPPIFFKSEFTEALPIKKLCNLIMDDGYDISITAEDSTVARLNELLKVPNLYHRIKRKNKIIRLSEFLKDLMSLVPCERKLEYSAFNKSDQESILKFNRVLLEELYPNDTPKHLYNKANLEYKYKDGMTDLQAKDVFNNLPQEIIYRPLDSKTIETIFAVYGHRAPAWAAEDFASEDVSCALGFRNKGAAKHSLERYEEAIKDYTKSIELEPDSPDTFICRARSFLKIGSLSQAFNDAAHAYEVTKINDPPENYMRLAIIFEECEKFQMVINCINEYLRHVKELDFYHDDLGDLWVAKEGYKSTSFSTTGNIIQIDLLNVAKEILNRIQKQYESDYNQQELFPCSIIDELKKDLSVTKKKINKSIKKLKVKKND